jgi:hypothetical protein
MSGPSYYIERTLLNDATFSPSPSPIVDTIYLLHDEINRARH